MLVKVALKLKLHEPHNWISFRVDYQHDLLGWFVVPDALVLVSYPVFALTEGGTVWRPSTQWTLGHCVTIAVCALEVESRITLRTTRMIESTHFFIRYLNTGRQLSTDIIWIFHLTSGEESSIAFALKPFDMFRINLFTLVHASLQIAVELNHLLLHVAHTLEWHVKFR